MGKLDIALLTFLRDSGKMLATDDSREQLENLRKQGYVEREDLSVPVYRITPVGESAVLQSESNR